MNDNNKPLAEFWKFRDTQKAIQLLENQELWFAHKSTLNDPFDMNLNILHIVENIKDELVNYDKIVAGIKGQIPYYEKALDGMFVFSTSTKTVDKHPYLDNLMWAHYGANGTGVCIGLNMASVRPNLTSFNAWHEEDKRWMYLPVERNVYYDQTRPIGFIKWVDGNIISSDNFFIDDILKRYSFVKGPEWKYESEYRFLTYSKKNAGQRGTPIKFDNDVICDIIYGINTPPKDIVQIKNIIVDKRWTNVRFWQTQITQELGRLEITPML